MNKPVVVSEETLAAPVSAPGIAAKAGAGPAYLVLGGISFSHFLNDTMQSLIPSVYPILKENYALDFAQIGMITLAFQFTASLLQPVVGICHRPKAQPFSLAIGMGFTFFGLLLLSVAHRLRDDPRVSRDWSAWAPRCSIRSPRASRGWRRAAAMASRNRCFRSAGISARRWGRCWRR